MKFALLTHDNLRDSGVNVVYLQWDGNEDAIRRLANVLYVAEDDSSCCMHVRVDPDVLFSEETVDELLRIRSHYPLRIMKVCGTMTLPHMFTHGPYESFRDVIDRHWGVDQVFEAFRFVEEHMSALKVRSWFR